MKTQVLKNKAKKHARRAAKSKAKKLAMRKEALKDMNTQTKSFTRVQNVSKEKMIAYVEAVLTNTAHLLESKQSEALSLPSIAISMKDFLEANDNSTRKSFNYTFYKDQFVKEVARKKQISISEAMNLKLLCTTLHTHHYRSMSECETHYRCAIIYSAKEAALFDMTINDYERFLDDASDDHVFQRAA